MVEKFTIEIARDGSITVTPPPKPQHTAEDFRAVIQKELGLSRTSPCRLHAHDSIAPKYSSPRCQSYASDVARQGPAQGSLSKKR
jgi:hypothetical protein